MQKVKSEVKYSIKKDDLVQVISGREVGKSGKILKINSSAGTVLVEKLNIVKRHVRPGQKHPQGGIVEKEAPIHYSNVLLFCSKCGKGVRHGIKIVEKKGGDSERVRSCKKCGSDLGKS